MWLYRVLGGGPQVLPLCDPLILLAYNSSLISPFFGAKSTQVVGPLWFGGFVVAVSLKALGCASLHTLSSAEP